MFKNPFTSAPPKAPRSQTGKQSYAYTSMVTLGALFTTIAVLWYLNERTQAHPTTDMLLQDQQLEEELLKEQQLKEKQLKEKQLKEQQLKDKQLKEKQFKEQQLKEKQLKEKQLNEQRLKEKQLTQASSANSAKKRFGALTEESKQKLADVLQRVLQQRPSTPTPAPPPTPVPDDKITQNPNEWRYPIRAAAAWLLSPHQAVALSRADSGGRIADIYPAGSRQKNTSVQSEAPISSVRSSPDSRLYATGDEQGTVYLYKTQGEDLVEIVYHDGAVHALDFTADGEYFASGDDTGLTRVYNTHLRRNEHTIRQGGAVKALALSADGRYLAVTNSDRHTRIYDLIQKKMIRKIAHDAVSCSLCFSPSGKYLAIGGEHGRTQLYSLRQTEPIVELPHRDAVHALAFSPDGRTLAAAAGKIVTVYHIPRARSKRGIEHSSPVIGLSFADEGETLYSATRQGLRKTDLSSHD